MANAGNQNKPRSTRSKLKDGGKDVELEGNEKGKEFSGKDTSPPLSADTSHLMKYINELMASTEGRLMEALSTSNSELKANMEQMGAKMQAINETLSDVQGNINKLEKKMGKKIGDLQSYVGTVDEKLQAVVQRSELLEKTAKEENISLKTEIQQLRMELENHKEKSEQQVQDLKNNIQAVAKENNCHFDRHYQDTEKWKEEVTNDIIKLSSSVSNNRHEIRSYLKQLEKMDDKIRSKSITIDGISEKKIIRVNKADQSEETEAPAKDNGIPENGSENQPVSQTTVKQSTKEVEKEDLTQIVFDLIKPALDDFTKEKILATYRLGAPKGKKPRQILVMLDDETTRGKILGKAPDIKKFANNRYLWINRDQNEGSRRKYGLVKACFKLLKENAHPCSMKGASISYNGKLYDYEMLSLLPENCRPENVKSKIFDDGKSLAFSSEFSYCSNFAPASLLYKGHYYTLAEHAFQATKAKTAGYSKLSEDIMGIHNPYYVKKLGGGIEKADDWDEKAEEVLEDIMREKFKQNPHLMDRLMNSTYTDFYEMTTDKKWGTGVKIVGSRPIDPRYFKGNNVTGHILRKLKAEFNGEDIESSSTGSESEGENGKEEDDINCTD